VEEVPLGSVVGARFRLTELLANGGMGAVYRAEDLAHPDHPVAVKLLHRDLLVDAISVERFVREAEVTGSIQHPHVVEVIAAGFDDDGVPFLAMECLEGRTLDQVLRDRGALPSPLACHLVSQVLSALSALHDRGVVHRDLKPENVFVLAMDHVKLCDFGIAALDENARARAMHPDLTPLGRIMGTPSYCAPEQIASATPADVRSDVYSVGVMLYELLTGEKPFQGTGFAGLCDAIVAEPPPPMRVFVTGIDPILEAIVMRALAKDPVDRPQTAVAFRASLEPFGATP
jgi:eukaryotic-like serine/threonine-protein kinase